MEDRKVPIGWLGIAFVIGGLVVTFLILVLGLKPTSLSIGPVELGIPKTEVSPDSQGQPLAQPSPVVQPTSQQQINPVPTATSGSVAYPTSTAMQIINTGPFREHQTVVIGTGVFAKVTFSDGLAPYDENWLWANNHFNIQRIRREENPNGCGSVLYEVSKIWIGVAAVAKVTVNGSEIGTITTITPLQKHGYIVDVSLKVGDTICVSPIPASGFHIVFGPDIYYHYDSYCYRGYC